MISLPFSFANFPLSLVFPINKSSASLISNEDFVFSIFFFDSR